MRERQPDVQRHQAGLGAGADQRQDENGRRRCLGRVRGADVGKGVAAIGTRQQPEREQQRERAEARHDQVDIAGADIVGDLMMRHDQRPGRQRHEFPCHQEREGVVGEHDDAHAGEKGRIERQHPARRVLVTPVSEREQTGAGGAEIDHGEEEGRERIEPEMRAEPRDSERKRGDRRQLG